MGVEQSSQGQSNKKTPSLLTMKDFKPEEFLGTWYEIAHTLGSDPASCQNAIASYTKTQVEGVYDVINSCYVNQKKTKSNTGKLWIPDPNSPSKMKVKFDGVLSSTSDYWVYWTDYINYALVGVPNGHFWILSRSEQIGFCVLQKLMKKSTDLGLGVGRKVMLDYDVMRTCTENETKVVV